MKRILVFGMTENPGGVESFIINYYRHIDRNRIQFDFLCNTFQEVAYENELKQLGANVYHIISRRQNRQKFRAQLTDLFKVHAKEWDAVWVNVCSLANIDYLKTAKRYGVKQRIIHSHNSRNMEGLIRRILHEWNKLSLRSYATDYWACSEEAADWFYKGAARKQTVIIPNAIDVKQYKHDPDRRKEIRYKLGLTDCFVIGNIGRLHFQKNQSFLIDVFAEYRKRRKDAFLLLVGGGEDEAMLKSKADEKGLSPVIYFAGVQHNITDYLDCFDLVLFPSRFEGLSIAALEAQANGLPVLLSDRCSQDTVVNGNVSRLALDVGTDVWCEEIDSLRRQGRDSITVIEKRFREKGFDLENEIHRLERLLSNEKAAVPDR